MQEIDIRLEDLSADVTEFPEIDTRDTADAHSCTHTARLTLQSRGSISVCPPSLPRAFTSHMVAPAIIADTESLD